MRNIDVAKKVIESVDIIDYFMKDVFYLYDLPGKQLMGKSLYDALWALRHYAQFIVQIEDQEPTKEFACGLRLVVDNTTPEEITEEAETMEMFLKQMNSLLDDMK